MTVLGYFDTRWKAARALRKLKMSGDTRTMTIEPALLDSGEDVFVLRAGLSLGTDVPVGRDAWPGLETGPQDVHGGDEAA